MARKSRNKKSRPEIPWNQVIQDFVTGSVSSLRTLALKYKIDRSNLQRRAKNENWDQQRAIFQEKFLAKTCDAVADAAAEAFQASFVEAIEDTRKVRRRATQVLLEQMDGSAELVPEAETVTLTKKTKDGTTVRKATTTKRDRPDARWVAEFLRSHTELLALVVNLRPKSEDIRIIEID